MANFDSFERKQKEGLTTAAQGRRALLAQDLFAIPADNKPKFAQGLGVPELTHWLGLSYGELVKLFPGQEIILDGANNQLGKDLLARQSATPIELKSSLDAKTDANLGLSTAAYLLGDSDGGARLREILAVTARRVLYLNTVDQMTRDAAIKASQDRAMKELADYFGQRLPKGTILSSAAARPWKAIAWGHTSQKTIKAAVNAKAGMIVDPVLLYADSALGLIPYEQTFEPGEGIIVERIAHDGGRAALVLRGMDSKITMKLYPNYKNSFHGPCGDVPASAWVKNPCFHIWISKPAA